MRGRAPGMRAHRVTRRACRGHTRPDSTLRPLGRQWPMQSQRPPAVSSGRDDHRRSERADRSAAGDITGIVAPTCRPGPRNQAGQRHNQPTGPRHRDSHRAGECDCGTRMSRRKRRRRRFVARHRPVAQGSRAWPSSADHPFDGLRQHHGQSNCRPTATERTPSTGPGQRQHRCRRQPRLEVITQRHQRADDSLGPGPTPNRHAPQQRHIWVLFA
jgi:hypothetical protein